MSLPSRKLGRSSVVLSSVGMGGVPLGEVYHKIEETQANECLEAAWANGIRYFDTSPWYGRGLSELRFGSVLRQKPRKDFVLSTKVGRVFHRPTDPESFQGNFWHGGLPFDHRFDYTYDGIMRSYEQSLMRLGMNTIDMLLIHDLDIDEMGSADLVKHHFRELEKSGWRALSELRRYGEIQAIGAGVNIMGTIPEFLRRFDMDFFLVAMPYTLLDQSPLDEEFPMCEASGAGIIIGAPFASGILASGSAAKEPFYNYLPATQELISKVKHIEVVCAHHGIPLKAAAYQFPLRHPLVASVVSGAETAAQAKENASLVGIAIPNEFWAELRYEGLIHALAP